MDKRKYIEDIELFLRFSDFIIRKKGRTILKDYDTTASQFRALQTLISNGGCMSCKELSLKNNLSGSTITDLINRMEKNNLITRERCKSDSRKIYIKVTEKGSNLLDEVVKTRCDFLEEVLQGMDESFLVSLKENLDILLKKLKQI